jgi:hypothetical protein
MLTTTPAERLEALQGFVDSVWEALGDDAETRILRDPSNIAPTSTCSATFSRPYPKLPLPA